MANGAVEETAAHSRAKEDGAFSESRDTRKGVHTYPKGDQIAICSRTATLSMVNVAVAVSAPFVASWQTALAVVSLVFKE